MPRNRHFSMIRKTKQVNNAWSVWYCKGLNSW